MGKLNNKWFRAAIPALFLHCSIGSVYCWSLVSQEIADEIGKPKASVEWAFSLAIFFLGMSAAFLGNLVEKDIHKSSLVATICFSAGMAGTGFAISKHSLVGIFLCYGVLMGIGLGTGYLSPVKTLMLWFKEQKGLATGLAVAGFGLAKVIASPLIQYLKAEYGIVSMFYILAVIYFVLMFIGHLFLKKPEGWVETPHVKSEAPVIAVFKNKTFIGIWLMFYINITCGLAIISQEKGIFAAIGLGAAGTVALLSSTTAVVNAAGRLGLSAYADRLKDRNTMYKFMFIICIAMTILNIVTKGITNQMVWVVLPLLFVVNACYGGGFSNVPTLLSDHFGLKTISQVHGLVLSAWAFAGLTGNQLASFIIEKTAPAATVITDAHGKVINQNGYQNVLYVTLGLYVVALIISFVLIRPSKRVEE